MTTPPIATELRSGFLLQNMEFLQDGMRFAIMEGNLCAATVVSRHGYDVLDMHYHFMHQVKETIGFMQLMPQWPAV